jgi:hypothetical protein
MQLDASGGGGDSEMRPRAPGEARTIHGLTGGMHSPGEARVARGLVSQAPGFAPGRGARVTDPPLPGQPGPALVSALCHGPVGLRAARRCDGGVGTAQDPPVRGHGGRGVAAGPAAAVAGHATIATIA